MENFKKLNIIERSKLSMDELCEYYRNERKHAIDTNAEISGVERKALTHPIVTFLIKGRRIINHQTLKTYINGELLDKNPEKVVKRYLNKDKGPIIFAITHTGKYDIELANESIQLPYYLLSDDEEYMHRTIDGYITNFNGVIYIDNDYESDQKVALETIKKTIKAGGNIMWYPERIWNLTPNQLMLPCKFGIVDAACSTRARVVPIAIDQVENEFNINIGTPFIFTDNVEELTKNQKIAGVNYLRDQMATLKWQLWEKNGITKRDSIPDDYYDKFVEKKISEWPFITKEDIDRMVFKPKNIVNYDEAFSHLNDIEYNQNNAFLLNKRLK